MHNRVQGKEETQLSIMPLVHIILLLNFRWWLCPRSDMLKQIGRVQGHEIHALCAIPGLNQEVASYVRQSNDATDAKLTFRIMLGRLSFRLCY
jgi:hypothetical protein